MRIDVAIVGEAVILNGNVPTFHLKQLALAAVQSVPGVVLVNNHLKVGAAR